ncbi:tetratricopeptide repeat protein [Bacillus sp. V3B]|uniref:tetratricopeptide repeat protein n=1 Tax=Bacillus sp. V3B TaxID=2804915 RepID=UPI00210D0D00|nr:tetratricopeptide repeat protein [Bacillus sp. V3B]MCQ6275692.1 tetratricopeptide repeat protein [Bacillus sp. V3B]
MSKNAQAKKTKGQLLSFIPTGEYYFSKGLKAFHRRDFHKALKYMQRAMQLEPGEPMIVCQLAIIHTELGEYQQSNRLLQLILEELDEEMLECHYFLANNFAHLGFFKDAYTHATLYLQEQEDGDFVEDAEDLLDILTFEADGLEEELYEQDDLMTKQEQARELLDSGDFPKAIELLKIVIEEFPEYWSAYNNLALAYFYLGELEKASEMLELVMERNPGNLQALCNKLVFAHFQKHEEEVFAIKEALKKVKPILMEHQYKLGATFSLIGEYEQAYGWLRKLHKLGYEGDGPFYYWLCYASYFTGKEQLARSLWEKVVELNPEKEGLEPWGNEHPTVNGFEEHTTSILKRLQSDHMEERLFAVFLISLSPKKQSILSSKEVVKNSKFSSLENQYISMVKMDRKTTSNQLEVAHETAEILYQHHQPIGTVEAGLYLMWFSVFIEMNAAKVALKNKIALAAAMEYVWNKLRSEKCSQQKVAQQYGLSSSTLQKYIKLVSAYLH